MDASNFFFFINCNLQCFKLFFHLSHIGTCHRRRIVMPKMRSSLIIFYTVTDYVVCFACIHKRASDNNGNISNLFYCYYSIDLQFAYTFCPFVLFRSLSLFLFVFFFVENSFSPLHLNLILLQVSSGLFRLVAFGLSYCVCGSGSIHLI